MFKETADDDDGTRVIVVSLTSMSEVRLGGGGGGAEEEVVVVAWLIGPRKKLLFADLAFPLPMRRLLLLLLQLIIW